MSKEKTKAFKISYKCRKCFSNSTLEESARRTNAVAARAQSTSRGERVKKNQKAIGNKKSPRCEKVQERNACSAGKLGAPDCKERQGASRWMQRPIWLKHTHGAGRNEPSRPSQPAGQPWFTAGEQRTHRSSASDGVTFSLSSQSSHIYAYKEAGKKPN